MTRRNKTKLSFKAFEQYDQSQNFKNVYRNALINRMNKQKLILYKKKWQKWMITINIFEFDARMLIHANIVII